MALNGSTTYPLAAELIVRTPFTTEQEAQFYGQETHNY